LAVPNQIKLNFTLNGIYSNQIMFSSLANRPSLVVSLLSVLTRTC